MNDFYKFLFLEAASLQAGLDHLRDALVHGDASENVVLLKLCNKIFLAPEVFMLSEEQSCCKIFRCATKVFK